MKPAFLILGVSLLHVNAREWKLFQRRRSRIQANRHQPQEPIYDFVFDQNNLRPFQPPKLTEWKPTGTPRIPNSNDIPNASRIADTTAFRTMHGNINNADELNIAASPMFELDWVTQTDMYVAEGPTFDDHGNLYFSPLYPMCVKRLGGCDVSLVSLNAETGEERWTIEGDGINTGGGAVLILNDDSSDEPRSLIYHVTISEIMCLDKDKNIIWRHDRTTTVLRDGLGLFPHSWGFTYVPQHDALVTVHANGVVAAYARATGEVLVNEYFLPGRQAPISEELPGRIITRLGNLMTNRIFGEHPEGTGLFEEIVKIIFGGAQYPIANTLGVDPNTGHIFIAGMAPDGQDGKIDYISENGAVYKIVLSNNDDGTYSFDVPYEKDFKGGSGATPTITADGKLLLVSDNENNVIALDPENFEELWRVDVGDQVAASVAVSIDNNEIYAITRQNVIKIIYSENDAMIQWIGNLDAYERCIQFNALTPTITANGVVVSIGNGIEVGSSELMTSVGMGILDRETGQLRYFAEGREESIAVSTLNSDGNIYTANSPVRRVISAALGSIFPRIPQLIGGISKYRTIRHDLLVRDAACAASNIARNLQNQDNPSSTLVSHECKRMQTLVRQAKQAVTNAEISRDYSLSEAIEVVEVLDTISTILETNCLDEDIAIELEGACKKTVAFSDLQ